MELALNLRVPYWCDAMQIKLDGQNIAKIDNVEHRSDWLTLKRTWQTTQQLEIVFSLSLRTEKFGVDRIAADDPRVSWHEQDWVKRGFILEQGIESDLGYNTKQIITQSDIQPHIPADVLMYGPLVLSRDVRLATMEQVFDAMSPDQITGIKSGTPHDQIWKVFDLTLTDGRTISFCDFSSAGNTWDSDSTFNTWLSHA
jgi:hypothetical protein